MKEYSKDRGGLMHRLRKLLVPIAVVGILAMGFLALGFNQNVRARTQLRSAQQLDAQQRYDQAADVLQKSPSFLVLGGTKADIARETRRNEQWRTYHDVEIKAVALLEQQHYAEALKLLRGISDDYPGYAAVRQSMLAATTALQPAPVVAPKPAPVAVRPPAPKPVPAPVKTPTVAPPTSYIVTTSLCRVDARLAPDLIHAAQDVADTCQANFHRIEQILNASDFAAPHRITLTNTTYAIAYTIGNDVTVQISYLRSRPDDMGMIVHELAHVVQNYPGGPGWVTEGIADYVRHQLGYSPSWYYVCDSNSTYASGYTCAANFLGYVQRTYDANLIKELNATMRNGTYSDNFFKVKTGKTLSQLYAACRNYDCKGGHL